jgi:hypothetical protein
LCSRWAATGQLAYFIMNHPILRAVGRYSCHSGQQV